MSFQSLFNPFGGVGGFTTATIPASPFTGLFGGMGGSDLSRSSDTSLVNHMHLCLQNATFIASCFYKERSFNVKHMKSQYLASQFGKLPEELLSKLDSDSQLFDEISRQLEQYDRSTPYEDEQLTFIIEKLIECYLQGMTMFKDSSFLPNIKQTHKYFRDACYYCTELLKRKDGTASIERKIRLKQSELNDAIDRGNEVGTALILSDIDELQHKLENQEGDVSLAEKIGIMQTLDRQLASDFSNKFTREELEKLFGICKEVYLEWVEPRREQINRQIRADDLFREAFRNFGRRTNQFGQNQENIQQLIQQANDISPRHGQIMSLLLRLGQGTIPTDLTDVDVPLPEETIEKVGETTFKEYISEHPDKSEEVCAICQEQFQEDDTVRSFQCCNNALHKDCIDVWLRTNNKCIFCRKDLREVYGDDSSEDESNQSGRRNYRNQPQPPPGMFM